MFISIQELASGMGCHVHTNLEDLRVIKPRRWVPCAVSVCGGERIELGCQQPTLLVWPCARTRRVLEGCVVVFQQRGQRVRAVFVSAVSFLGFGIPPCSGELSLISCGAVLLKQRCVPLAVRVEYHALPQGIGSNIECVPLTKT